MDVRMQNYLKRKDKNQKKKEAGEEQRYGFVAKGGKKGKSKRINKVNEA